MAVFNFAGWWLDDELWSSIVGRGRWTSIAAHRGVGAGRRVGAQQAHWQHPIVCRSIGWPSCGGQLTVRERVDKDG